MSKPRGIRPGTALAVAAAAIPASYIYLLRNCPNFWKDVDYVKTFGVLFREMIRRMNSGETIVDLFERFAKAQPHHPCILFEKETYTYEDVRSNACRVARWVGAADPNLRKGDAVCFLLQNSAHFVWTWLGFLKKGIITSLLNYNLKPNAILECIKTSEAKKLVFGAEYLGLIMELLPELRALNVEPWLLNDSHIHRVAPPVEIVTMNWSTMSGAPMASEPMELDDMAVYIFTSGTTGLPKPANVPHAKIIGSFLITYFAQLTKDDIYYVPLPLYHSAALLMGLCGTWRTGGTVALAKRFSATQFWDDIRRFQATGFQYIGEVCRYLLAQPKSMHDGKYPRKLRIALGNGLRPDIWSEFQNRFNIGKIVEIYSATESNNAFVNYDGKIGSLGRYPWILKKILDNVQFVEYEYETGEPLRGKDGFCIMSPVGKTALMLFKIDDRFSYTGYKGNKEKSEKKMVTNVKQKGDVYFNTGDLLKIDEENYVYFMDRIGDTFRWKGENVSTMEVSEVLGHFPAILEANVYGVQIPGKDGRAGMAAIVLNEGEALNLKDLYAHVAVNLPEYACPKFIRLLPKMEVTGTFKHKKVDLVKQGYDMNLVKDDLFVIEPSQKTYVPLTSGHVSAMVSGRSKL